MSLIELMISITLGLIILSALSTLFINQTRARVELDKSNRMIDNGRYAMELLAQDLRLAGYLGEFVPTLSSCSSAPVGIGGRDAGLTTKPSTAGITNLTAADVREGSDIVVINRVSTSTPTAQPAAVPGVRYLQVSLCQYDSLSYLIGSPSLAPTGNPAGVTPQDFFILRTKSCKADDVMPYQASNLADVRRIVEHIYFVSPNNEDGDGIPTLKRQETNPNTGALENVSLVEGIEFMQIEYGIDLNNTFQISAETNAGSLVLSDLTADPVAARIKPGMGVYDASVIDPNIPAGYTVGSMTPPDPVTGVLGTITLVKGVGAGPIVSSAPAPPATVPLTIPYLTATVTPGSNILTNVSAQPADSLVQPGFEVCAKGLEENTTIANFTKLVTPITITLSKPATSCDPLDPFAACDSVPLTIPAIEISPKTLAGDGVADMYKAAPLPTEWPNVVSVKLTIVARNTEKTDNYEDTKTYTLGRNAAGAVQTYAPPVKDHYKRHVYTQFIRLVNVAGRRE